MPKYVSSVAAAIGGVQKYGRTSKAQLEQGLYDAAQEAYRRSQVYVPVEFGDLRASGVILQSGQVGGIKTYVLTYGGPSADYALPVHEIVGARHAPPTCYKYLEKAVRESRNQQSYAIKRRMMGEVRGAMKKPGGKRVTIEEIAEFGGD